MGKTIVEVRGENFYINGKLTYSEIEGSNPSSHGLLMNARFIQGIFDDKADRSRFARFGHDVYDPMKNTENLIAALPEWYSYGLRAFTVGFQGGGPVFTVSNDTIYNNPFGEDGKSLDIAYAERMDKLIRAADEIGMVVIVSFLYGSQTERLKDDDAVIEAVKTASHFLRYGKYTNVIVEIANEHNVGNFKKHPIVYEPEGVVSLIDIARKETGMLVACSGVGNYGNEDISKASDVVLIHGNGCTRQHLYNLIRKVKAWCPDKPIVCNEDSQCFGQLEVTYKTHTSWGYYNNLTKQEPPANWSVTKGEDRFFAYRMAQGIGIKLPEILYEEQFYFQGFEPLVEYENKRWLRVASLYPEKINYVEFYKNGELVYTAYDEPFLLFYETTWIQEPWIIEPDTEWKAMIHLHDANVIEKVKR